MRVLKSTRAFLELIKFEHTIFALPFAYLGMILAARGLPNWHDFFWITMAMVAARTLAMGANRLVDRELDSRNPRTAGRPLVVGQISAATVWVGLAVSGAVLTLAAYVLGPLPFAAAAGCLAVSARLSLRQEVHQPFASDPGLYRRPGAYGRLGSHPRLAIHLRRPPGMAVVGRRHLLDRRLRHDLCHARMSSSTARKALHAVPARYGVPTALRLSAACHIVAGLLLVGLGWSLQLGLPYWLGMAVTLGLLAYEHVLVTPDDLSRIDFAFFNLNSVISITLFTGTLVSQLLPALRA